MRCLEYQGKKIERKNNKGNSKKIEQIDKKTNKIIKKYDSVVQASKELSL